MILVYFYAKENKFQNFLRINLISKGVEITGLSVRENQSQNLLLILPLVLYSDGSTYAVSYFNLFDLT